MTGQPMQAELVGWAGADPGQADAADVMQGRRPYTPPSVTRQADGPTVRGYQWWCMTTGSTGYATGLDDARRQAGPGGRVRLVMIRGGQVTAAGPWYLTESRGVLAW